MWKLGRLTREAMEKKILDTLTYDEMDKLAKHNGASSVIDFGESIGYQLVALESYNYELCESTVFMKINKEIMK